MQVLVGRTGNEGFDSLCLDVFQGGVERFLVCRKFSVPHCRVVLVIHHFKCPTGIRHAVDMNFHRATIGRVRLIQGRVDKIMLGSSQKTENKAR